MRGFEMIPNSQPEGDPERLPFEREEIEASDEYRAHMARKFGLPPGAGMDQIGEREEAEFIGKIAAALGMDRNSTYDEVRAEQKRLGIEDKGYVLSLGLRPDASPDEVEAAEREREAEEREVLREIAEEMRANRAKDVTPKFLQ